MIARWICITYWTVMVASVAALLTLLPIAIMLFLIAPGWMFSEGPPDWALTLYFLLWIGGAFMLARRGHFPGTAIPTTTHRANCGYDLTGNTTGICPECGEPIPHRAAP